MAAPTRAKTFTDPSLATVVADTQAKGDDAVTAGARANSAADDLETAQPGVEAARDAANAAAAAAQAVVSPLHPVQGGSGAPFDLLFARAQQGVRDVELPAATDDTLYRITRLRRDASFHQIILSQGGTAAWSYGPVAPTADGPVTLAGAGGRADATAWVQWSAIPSGTYTPGASEGVRLSPSVVVGAEARPLVAGRARQGAALAVSVGAHGVRLDAAEATLVALAPRVDTLDQRLVATLAGLDTYRGITPGGIVRVPSTGVVTSVGIRWPDAEPNGGSASTVRVYRYTSGPATGALSALKGFHSPSNRTVVYTIPRDGGTGLALAPVATFEAGNTSNTPPS